jgi:hypothetical protein
VVLGKKDDVIDPTVSQEWIKKEGKGKFDINIEGNNHRTPIGVFSKYMGGLGESRVEMKQHIKLFEEFINEGGWATTKTQGTAITPDVIGEVVKVMDYIEKEFTSHLNEIGLPPADFIKPIGSGTWWKEDVEGQPEKTYGDVDFLVSYPTLKLTAGKDREDEIATTKLYNSELLMLITADRMPKIDLEETKKISNESGIKLIVEVPLKTGGIGYVQVDIVTTHQEYTDWTVFRMTPIRNIKGFVLGNLYSSFGEVLDLSIQTRGVRAKFEGQVMAPYSKRAGVDERLISANAGSFMQDIAKFFWQQSGTDKPYEPSARLAAWKGMNPNDPKFEDLCEGIRGVAETLEQLGEFGTTIKYKSSAEFLSAVVGQFDKKMMSQFNASKFNKAASPEAKKAVDKIRGMIKEYISKAQSLLK